MQGHSSSGPHRTDRKRGSRVRIEPGIYQRGGRWIISFSDASGEHYVTLGSIDSIGIKEVRAERERRRVKARDGEIVAPKRERLDDVAEDFFSMFESLVSRGERSERTLELYRGSYENHIKPALGRKRVQVITAQDVSRLIAELRRKRKVVGKPELLSDWTVSGVYRLLSTLFTHAVVRGLINDTPLRRLARNERPRPKNANEPRILTHDEIAKLLEHAPPKYRTLLATAVFTGLRLSELLGLRWQDIDLREGFVRVRHQLSVAKRDKPARLKSPKTETSRRDVVLLPQLAELLKRHREEALAFGHAGSDSYVFCTGTGTPMHCHNVRVRGLTPAADKAGLNVDGAPRLTMHDLRHTFASHLILDLKLDAVQVSRQLGHAKPSMTLDIYAGLFDKARHADDLRRRMAESDFGRALGALS